jgi:hypothetical protein
MQHQGSPATSLGSEYFNAAIVGSIEVIAIVAKPHDDAARREGCSVCPMPSD